MYFPTDKELDDVKIEEGHNKIIALSDEEKGKYAKELMFYLRQQAFYSGLDSIKVCRLFKTLYIYEKHKISRAINIKDEDDEECCSISETTPADLLNLLKALKSKMKSKGTKESNKEDEAESDNTKEPDIP